MGAIRGEESPSDYDSSGSDSRGNSNDAGGSNSSKDNYAEQVTACESDEAVEGSEFVLNSRPCRPVWSQYDATMLKDGGVDSNLPTGRQAPGMPLEVQPALKKPRNSPLPVCLPALPAGCFQTGLPENSAQL